MKLYVIEVRISAHKWQRLRPRYASLAAAESALARLPGQHRIQEV